MSNIVSLSVVVTCAALLGAISGYRIARRRCRPRRGNAGAPSGYSGLQRFFLSLLGSIIGSLVSSVSSYVLVTFSVPQMLVEWAFRMVGA